MTAVETRWRGACAWMLSFVVHVVGLGTALVIAAERSPLPKPQPFQWNVSIVTAASPTPVTSDIPSPLPVEAPASSGVADAESAQASEAGQADRSAEGNQSATAALEAVDSAPSNPLLSEADITEALFTPPQAKWKDRPQDVTLVAALAPHAPSASLSGERLTDPMPNSTERPPPEVDAADSALLASQPSFQRQVQLVHRPPMQFRGPVVSRVVHADYGWLAKALFARVERFKQYPQLARSNRWEGDVILQAIVSDRGDVRAVTVAKSSGYVTLDQDAVSLLHRVSPVALQHPLGQSQVVVQIPISYRLE